MTDSNAEESWRIACASESFDQWRDDPSFRAVVTLARIVNALNFAGYAMYGVVGVESPAATRQRLNAIMYTGATLFEAIDFVDRSQRDLAIYGSFRDGLQPIIEDLDVRDLYEKRLRPLRNRGVCHFDPTFVPKTPGSETDGYYVFVTGRSMKTGESYYDLPDRSVMNTVIGVGPSHFEFTERARALVGRISKLMASFIVSANDVINEALSHDDWEPKFIPDLPTDIVPPPA